MVKKTFYLMLVIATMLVSGCNMEKPRAWAGVVGDSLVEQIDRWIGEEQVIRKEAELAVAGAQASIADLETKAAVNRAGANEAMKQVEALRLQKEASARDLEKVADLLRAGQPISTTSGTTLTLADQRQLASRMATAHETLLLRLATTEERLALLTEAAEESEKTLLLARQNLAALESSLELLDSKVALMAALRDRAETLPSDAGTANQISEAEALLDTLTAEVDQQIEIARILGNMREGAATEITLDDVVPADDQTLLNEIDALLGK